MVEARAMATGTRAEVVRLPPHFTAGVLTAALIVVLTAMLWTIRCALENAP